MNLVEDGVDVVVGRRGIQLAVAVGIDRLKALCGGILLHCGAADSLGSGTALDGFFVVEPFNRFALGRGASLSGTAFGGASLGRSAIGRSAIGGTLPAGL